MNFRVCQIALVFLVGWGPAFLSSPIAGAAVYEGYLMVGSRKYDVTLQIIKNAEESFWVGTAISESGVVVSRFGAQIDGSGGSAAQGETDRAMPPDLARQWLRELDTKFLALLDTTAFLVTVAPDSAVTCESRSPLMLTDAVAGKVRLKYNFTDSRVVVDPTPEVLRRMSGHLQLTEIHAFSLEEWLNGFGERVILSLRRAPKTEEGMPW